MSKKLVVYFSASGVTERVAEEIARVTGGRLYEIVPLEPYTNEDLNWNDRNSRSSREMRDKSSRPEILKRIKNIEDYDVIYLGFPIWWGIAPTIVNTFLENYDFTGKTIITFATSGGSGMGNSTEELKKSAPNAKFISGDVITVSDVEEFISKVEK